MNRKTFLLIFSILLVLGAVSEEVFESRVPYISCGGEVILREFSDGEFYGRFQKEDKTALERKSRYEEGSRNREDHYHLQDNELYLEYHTWNEERGFSEIDIRRTKWVLPNGKALDCQFIH